MLFILNCDGFKAVCEYLEGPERSQDSNVKIYSNVLCSRLDSGYFHRHHGFTRGGGRGLHSCTGATQISAFHRFKEPKWRMCRGKTTTWGPSIDFISNLFQSRQGFGLGEGLEHFGCFSWVLWGWKEGSRGEESRGGQGDWLSWGIRSASGSWIKTNQEPPRN